MNLKQACARNQAVWADAQLRAHGVDCRYSDLLWTCWESGVATSIHNEVITIASETDSQRGQTVREIEQFVAARGHESISVQDWWDELDLTPLGFKLIWNTDTDPAPYLLRPPGNEPQKLTPSELTIGTVTTPEALLEFERASHEGYESEDEYIPNGWHHPASLDDPNLTYIVGRVDGKVVTTGIPVVSDGVNGIYGIATIPEYRRRGYGRAVTWAAINVAPDLPAVLGPSDMAEPLYRDMGFADFTSFRMWQRPATP